MEARYLAVSLRRSMLEPLVHLKADAGRPVATLLRCYVHNWPMPTWLADRGERNGVGV